MSFSAAFHFRPIASAMRVPRPALNRFVSRHAFRPPATDAPCRPAPIGRNRHRIPLRSASHRAPPAHGEGAFKSHSRFHGLKFQRHAHASPLRRIRNDNRWTVPAFRSAREPLWRRTCPELKAKEPPPADIIRRCVDNEESDIDKGQDEWSIDLSFRIRFSGEESAFIQIFRIKKNHR
jgi:hypothetical protein